MKRIIIIAIAALFSFGQGVWALSGSWSDYIANGYGDNSDQKTIYINTPEQLALLASEVKGGNSFSDFTIILTEDLDLSAHYWEPIGYGTNDEENMAFRGTFKGNDHTISGLYINKPEGTGVGLFGYIHNPARIENVKIASGSITGNFLVGAIVGNYCGKADDENVGIFNCKVEPDVTVEAVATEELTGSNVGGIIGYIQYGATISHCTSSATVVGDEYTGGIVGNVFAGYDETSYAPCTITECYNLGEVKEKNASATGKWAVLFPEPYDATINITLLDNDWDATIDNSIRIFNYEGATVNVTLAGRTLYKDNSWNTLCVPFNFDKSIFKGTSLASPTVMELTSSAFIEEGQALSLNFNEVGDIAASYSYLVKWEVDKEEAIANPVFKNVIMGQQEQLDPREDEIGIITFKGMYTPQTIVSADKSILYMGADNKLYYPKTSMTINAFRAYFQLSEGYTCGDPAPATDPAPENSINNFVLNFGDDMTGISLINHRSSVTSDSWFTLDGRKLSGQPTAKGIYINHGHKVIIK